MKRERERAPSFRAATVMGGICIAWLLALGCHGRLDDTPSGGGGDGGALQTNASVSSGDSSRPNSNRKGTSSGTPSDEYFDLGVGIGMAPYHACVIQPDLTVVCFGAKQPRAEPPDGFRATQIGSGHLHNCAILPPDSTERVGCFGWGYQGDETPIEPPPGLDPTQIAVGEGTSCAVNKDSTVACWFGSKADAEPPEGLHAKRVETSTAFSCAIDLDDRVVCWGPNPPELPETDLRVRQIAVAQSEGTADPPDTRIRHACAVRLDHSVVCWGDDVAGEVSKVPADLRATEVALGYTEACAVSLEGGLVCWGDPPGGFERPEGGLKARAVRISHGNGCALLADEDKLACWGFDDPNRYKDGIPDGASVYVPSH